MLSRSSQNEKRRRPKAEGGRQKEAEPFIAERKTRKADCGEVRARRLNARKIHACHPERSEGPGGRGGARDVILGAARTLDTERRLASGAKEALFPPHPPRPGPSLRSG